MKRIVFLAALILPFFLSAQKGYIVYKTMYNGEVSERRSVVVFDGTIAEINAGTDTREKNYIDYKNKQTIQLVKNQDGSYTGLRSPFEESTVLKKENITETIAGVVCKKATFVVNSNTIELFYNEDHPVKGAPSIGYMPQLGTILKAVRNGNSIVQAVEINQGTYKGLKAELPPNVHYAANRAAFTRSAIESRFTTINIFNNDTINFSDKYPKVLPDKLNQVYHYANGNILLKKIKLPVFKSSDAVFITVTQRSNGDAYDRTGLVFAIPVDQGAPLINAFKANDLKVLPAYKAANGKHYYAMVDHKSFTVPYELMRFFTPFGIGAYNERSQIEGYNWPDSASYSQEITDMKTALSGREVYIMMSVNNYDAGGHVVSLDLKVYPGSGNKNAIAGNANFHKMLFNTTNVAESMGQGLGDMFGTDSLKVAFTLDKPLKDAYLRYVSTGWGGWGNGDEFLPKINDIFLNGKKVFSFIPWRSDCVTYRNLNPVSGNFGNGLSSSDLSRSNWCPGTTTNPIHIPLGDLKPGKHLLKVAIPMGKPEGSSYSGWNVSGLLEGVQ